VSDLRMQISEVTWSQVSGSNILNLVTRTRVRCAYWIEVL
jgi:hypothetical protein